MLGQVGQKSPLLQGARGEFRGKGD